MREAASASIDQGLAKTGEFRLPDDAAHPLRPHEPFVPCKAQRRQAERRGVQRYQSGRLRRVDDKAHSPLAAGGGDGFEILYGTAHVATMADHNQVGFFRVKRSRQFFGIKITPPVAGQDLQIDAVLFQAAQRERHGVVFHGRGATR